MAFFTISSAVLYIWSVNLIRIAWLLQHTCCMNVCRLPIPVRRLYQKNEITNIYLHSLPHPWRNPFPGGGIQNSKEWIYLVIKKGELHPLEYTLTHTKRGIQRLLTENRLQEYLSLIYVINWKMNKVKCLLLYKNHFFYFID